MRRFYIEKPISQGETVRLPDAEARHAARVLRLSPGGAVELFDGAGNRYDARLTEVSADSVTAVVEKAHPAPQKPGLSITLAPALLKADKMDECLSAATQLGISAFLPFPAARSVPRPDAKRVAARLGRWERIALEAVKQCGRPAPPRVKFAADIDEILAERERHDLALLFWEKEPRLLAEVAAGLPPPRSVLLVLGPEGGFTDCEAGRMREAGFTSAGLGPRILRAETAVLAALVLVQHLFGDMGGSR